MTKPQITLPQITFRELLRPPARSADGQATMYLDRATSSLLISVDGYNYVPLGTGSLTVGSTTVALSTNEICTFTNFELAGGGLIAPDVYDFITVGSVSRDSLIHTVVLYNTATNTVVASHDHTSISSTSLTTSFVVSAESVFEVRHKLTGTLIDGDFGQLISAMTKRS